MKGAFSSPDREMYYQTYRHLFPDNCYRFSSGGYPEAIPDLTYEKFIDYYKTYYHPSNSYIFLYGDADLSSELAFIDTAYLSAYDRADMALEIPKHEPFDEMKEIMESYPVPSGAETEGQSSLRLGFVVGDGSDMELNMALRVLQDVLVNQESAPLRLALQEAGIGQDITAYASSFKQPVFMMTVKNANPEDKDQFREIVYKTLARVVEEGLDKEAVEGTINRMEFRLREGDDAQKGITYVGRILSGWMYSGDPYKGLEYEKPIAEVKTALTTDYLEQIIERNLINNPHALLLVMKPERGLEEKINERTTEKLARFKSGLSEEEVAALIRSTGELIAHQDEEDTPEALATIPKLSLEDVNPDAEWFEVENKVADGQTLLYFEEFTNNVLHADFIFDLRRVNQELIPYVSILQELLGKLNTENFSFEDLEKNLNIHTGGFNPTMRTYLDSKQNDKLLPKFMISVKAVNDKSDKLVELAGEIILRTDYADTTRIRNLLNKHLARVELDVKRDGFYYASTRQRSYHSREGVFSELSAGVSYYWFLNKLMADFDKHAEGLIQNLTLISSSLFTKNNMIICVTCGKDDYPAFESGLTTLAGSFPEETPEVQDWELVPEMKNEGLMAASKVHNVMGSEWLHPQIRVKGGAYGGFGRFRQNGEVYFGSYRDPNLGETLENFAGTPGFLKEFTADNAEMTQFIIGTVGIMDIPRTPKQKGNRAVRNYFSNYSAFEHQRIRDEVLATTLEDIHALEPLVTDVINQKTYCVYGNQEKIQANRELFNSVISIFE
jgi:Zn-dependent M16 (insulinase) family peptidase